MTYSISDPVFQFLGSYFHQDIESPEEALSHFMNTANRDYIIKIIENLELFLSGRMTEDEKNRYIKECADGIYFPDDGLSPVEWLSSVIRELRETF